MENFNTLKQKLNDLEEEKFNKEMEIENIDSEIQDTIQVLQHTFNKDKDNMNAVLNAETLSLLKKLFENIKIYNQIAQKCANCYYAEDCDYIDNSDKGLTCNLLDFTKELQDFVFQQGWTEFLESSGINVGDE